MTHHFLPACPALSLLKFESGVRSQSRERFQKTIGQKSEVDLCSFEQSYAVLAIIHGHTLWRERHTSARRQSFIGNLGQAVFCAFLRSPSLVCMFGGEGSLALELVLSHLSDLLPVSLASLGHCCGVCLRPAGGTVLLRGRRRFLFLKHHF